jgi:16S rRNA C1402 (ribose-2'-O) methylase RsmI
MHEEVIRGTIEEVVRALSRPARGEITLVIAGEEASVPVADVDLDALISEWKVEGLSTKEMSQRLQDDLGWKRNVAYQAILDALKTEQS